MVKKIIIVLCALCFHGSSYAETVYLKSGKVVEGRITQKTKEFIKINIFDVEVTYFNDEIEKISGDAPVQAVRPSLSQRSFITRYPISSDNALTTNAFPSTIAPFPAPAISSARLPSGRHCLWSVSSDNATVYLLGSLHLVKKEIYPLDAAIEEAFDDSQWLAVEINLNNLDILQSQSNALSLALYQGNDTLQNHLSKETMQAFESKMSKLGMDIRLFMKFKPWYIATQLTMANLLSLGFDPEYGIDRYFLNKAKGDKQILELENIDFQLRLLSGLSDKEQELFLQSTMIDIDIMGQQMEALTGAWLSGDVKTLEAITFKGLNEHPEMLPLYEKMYFSRNRVMADKIEALLKGAGTYFIVVGAGHLIGDEGLVKLLQQKGFSTEQM
jgi:uncharacterized protein YbaP (TraB family)